MTKISVYIIAFNEGLKIESAIKSVIDWADEVVVADSFSTDNTAEIAERAGAKVVQIPFSGFGELRNQAITHCQYPWIFSLDADERCTPAARDEILNICKADNPEIAAYYVPRRNYVLGRWVKYSGWYPDYRQPQLFRKGSLTYHPDPVHEGYTVSGQVAYLKSDIWQFPYENLTQMLEKANRYSSLGAKKLLDKKTGGFFKGFLHGLGIFLRTYLLKKGFLDGRAGFAIALGNFIGTFYKYAKLAELQKNWRAPTSLI
jgi:glycosyltransferase involved in cell wall biosynthesis